MADLKVDQMKLIQSLAITKNIVDQDGILRSSNDPDKQMEPDIVNESFYIKLMQTLNQTLKDNGDWTWMKDCLTGDILLGSDVQNIVKRYQLYSF